jgi:UDP-2,3-diacylglucosamine pyrophosphatase LpxH
MKVVIIPDCHLPYQVDGLAGLFRRIKRELKPDKVYCTGDLVDFYAFGRYVRDPEMMSAGPELRETRAEIQALSREIKELTVITGNHEARLFKRVLEAGIPTAALKSFAEILELPKGWNYVNGPLEIQLTEEGETAILLHGEEAGGQSAMFQLIRQYRQNIICGHLHSQAGILYLNNGVETNWSMVCGSLVDQESLAFAYGKHFRDKPVLTFGFINDGIPQLIPAEAFL